MLTGKGIGFIVRLYLHLCVFEDFLFYFTHVNMLDIPTY